METEDILFKYPVGSLIQYENDPTDLLIVTGYNHEERRYFYYDLKLKEKGSWSIIFLESEDTWKRLV